MGKGSQCEIKKDWKQGRKGIKKGRETKTKKSRKEGRKIKV